jgi:hypothetical protein
MGIEITVADGAGGGQVADVNSRGGHKGLVVFSEPLKELDDKILSATNPDFGVQMAITGGFAGSPTGIHNGTDSGFWTATTIAGTKFTYNSTDFANNGTKSIKIANPAQGDSFQLSGTYDVPLANYSALTAAVYVDKDWSAGDSISVNGWSTTTTGIVGVAVNVESYINEFIFNTWQNMVIPLEDMQLEGSTIDAIRFENRIRDGGKSPTLYLDDIQLEQTSTSAEYTIRPSKDTIFYLRSLRVKIIDNVASTVTGGTMNGLAYDKILGLARISNGITFRRFNEGIVRHSFTVHQLSEFFDAGYATKASVSDGTNTYIELERPFGGFSVLDDRHQDYISVSINDDLSSLISLKIVAVGEEGHVDH